MGKSKAAQPKVEPGTPRHSSGSARATRARAAAAGVVPPAALVASCVGGSGNRKAPGPRLWLSVEGMHAAGLGAGAVVLVSLAETAAPGPAAFSPAPIGSPFAASPGSPFVTKSPGIGNRTPGASPHGPATRLPAPESVRPLSLWTRAAEVFGVPVPQDLEGSDNEAAQPCPGEFAVCCSVWPAPRLKSGEAALSPALMDLLMRPEPGHLLAISALSAQQQQQLRSAGPDGAAAVELRLEGGGVVSAGADASSAEEAAEKSTPTPLKGTPRPGQRKGSGTPGNRGGSEGGAKPSSGMSSSSTLRFPGLWIDEMLESGGQEQLRMLEALARSHLEGHRLLPGSLVLVPLTGADCVLTVTKLEGELLPVTLETSVRISRAAPRTSSGAGAEAEGASSGSNERRRVVESAVAAARSAAAEAGVSEEAACSAAEAAAEAGLRGRGVDFKALGGVQEQMAALHRMVSLPLQSMNLLKQYGVPPPCGLLLHGPPGTGKTMLARAAATEADASLLVVNGPDVVSEFFGDSEAGLLGVWSAARALEPSIIFLDEVDAIAGSRSDKGGGGASGRLVTSLLQLMDSNASNPSRVVVIAASNRPDALDPALRRPGRFDAELEVGVPSPAGRFEILQTRMVGLNHSLTEDQIRALAASTHGYVGADLSSLVDEAALQALRRQVIVGSIGRDAAGDAPPEGQKVKLGGVTWADFRAAETRVMPSAMREVALEVPNVRWTDIGGQDHVKQSLQEAIEWPFKHSDALARLGAKPPAGVLLYGPPGCSKTLLARACACEAGLNFFSVKGPELFSKWVGESEKSVAALFARARTNAPSIIFFDEIDGLAASRQSGGSGAPSVEERVLSQLLGEMDGLVGRQGVVVVAATNRPDCVDAALLRPGRLDRLVYVSPPVAAEREAIFRVQLKRTALNEDVAICDLASKTENYTGADISSVCREAALAALKEDIDSLCVSRRHFDAAMELVPPSGPLSWTQSAMYESFARSQGSARGVV